MWNVGGNAGSSLADWSHAGAGYYRVAAATDCIATTTGAIASADWAYVFPLTAPAWGGIIDQLAFRVTTAVALSNTRIGLYTNTANNNLYPNRLIADSGSISTASTGVKTYTLTTPYAANAGALYWLLVVSDNTPTLRSLSLTASYPTLGFDSGMTGGTVGWNIGITYGALPDPCTAGGSAIVAVPIPMLAARFSS